MKNVIKKYILALIVMSLPAHYVAGSELSYARQIVEVETSPRVLEAREAVKNAALNVKILNSNEQKELLERAPEEVKEIVLEMAKNTKIVTFFKNFCTRSRDMYRLLTNESLEVVLKEQLSLDSLIHEGVTREELISKVTNFFEQVNSLNNDLKSINKLVYQYEDKLSLVKKGFDQRAKLAQLVKILRDEWDEAVNITSELYALLEEKAKQTQRKIGSFECFQNDMMKSFGASVTIIAQHLLEQRDMIMEKILAL